MSDEPVAVGNADDVVDAASSAPATETLPDEESTVGTGSIFAIGCSILALLFVCVGVGIFMWRQVN